MARCSKQHGSPVPPAVSGALRRWARWGISLRVAANMQSETADTAPPDLTPVRRVVAAFRSIAKSESLHLQQLLDQSDLCLAPLSDPLRLSLQEHRWLDLRREREESYTDWLAWLLQEAGSAEAVLKVFGLESTEFGSRVRSAPPQVDREETIAAGGGKKKRLDLVVRFGETGILLVEVKVRPIEEAGGSDNLEVYLEWLKSQEAAVKHAILLVPDSLESPCGGWDVRTWGEVGLGLRAQAMVLRKAAPPNLLVASSLLCFAGAVEQNVLGLAGAKVLSAAPQTALYLERFLGENRS